MTDLRKLMDMVGDTLPEGHEMTPEQYAAESKEMMFRLMTQMCMHLHGLAGVVKHEEGPFEPWVQDLISVAAENVEKVFHYLHYNAITAGDDIMTEGEGPKPNNPELWKKAVTDAKKRFRVWPSAYASGYAAKTYKEQGGTWSGPDHSVD